MIQTALIIKRLSSLSLDTQNPSNANANPKTSTLSPNSYKVKASQEK